MRRAAISSNTAGVPDATEAQQMMCAKYGAPYVQTPPDAIVGVADNVRTGTWPLNGLRHSVGGTSGWFLFGGTEMSDEPDFYKPLHAGRLSERCPEVIPYLGLGPGWRFLIAPGHEDVWEDPPLRDETV